MADVSSAGTGTGGLIDAATASRRLGVKPATLYAYVSRGRIRRHRRDGERGSWYDPAEVDALRRGRGDPAGNELAITTAITRIADDHLWYRGHDVAALCRDVPFEAVCSLLWHGTFETRPFAAPAATVELVGRAVRLLGPDARLIDRLAVAVGVAASADPLRFDLSPEAVADSGRRLIATLVESLPPRQPAVPVLRLPDGVRRGDTVAARLWSGLAPAPIEGGVAALNAILILLADHELATSTLATRVAASTRANPYAAVSAALGVFDGPLHGTVSEEVFTLLADSGRIGAPAAIAERLRRGHPMPGFGHRLYRAADPRAEVMLDVVGAIGRRTRGGTARFATTMAVRDTAAAKSTTFPNSDFGLGAFTFMTGMEPDAGEAIFAIARVAGWVAHALEEYAAAPLRFRSRAVYTGVMP